MCELLASSLICYGALGYAAPLNSVAERRYAAEWGRLSDNPAAFDVLLGVEDCSLLGRQGWLIANDKAFRAQVTDCNQMTHPWPAGYLGDVNRAELNCERGYLILPPKRARWWYEERH